MLHLQYHQLPLMLTGIIMFIFLLAAFLVFKKIRNDREREENFIKQIEIATTGNIEKNNNNSLLTKYSIFWNDKLKKAGFVKRYENDRRVTVKVTLLFVVTYLIFFFLLQDPFFGLVPMSIVIAVLIFVSNQRIASKQKKIDNQIPGFLSSLKSNIQANIGPENALINAINNTSQPLYGDLEIAKSLIETGSFTAALAAMRHNTKSKSLKFLCSCIELSSDVGANLEEQITIIEDMMISQKALDRKLNTALTSNKPLIFASVILIPGLFMYMYLTSPQAQDFWFNSPLSWMIKGIIASLAFMGLFLCKRFINSAVRNI